MGEMTSAAGHSETPRKRHPYLKTWQRDWLKSALGNLKPGTALYKLLKSELSKQGHWKDKPRGDARKGGIASKNGRLG